MARSGTGGLVADRIIRITWDAWRTPQSARIIIDLRNGRIKIDQGFPSNANLVAGDQLPNSRQLISIDDSSL